MRLDPARAGQDRRNKVNRIETGRLLPSVVDVEQMLTGLGVDHQTRHELLSLARVANAEYQDIRLTVRRGLHNRQNELAALEAGATRMRYFLPALITGLLQTPEYLRQALSSPIDPVVVDRSRSMAAKLARQSVLHDEAKQFEFLLTESAVRWQLCEPLAMATQMDRLISVSRLPNVRMGILPQDVRIADGPMNGFVVYDKRLVTIELFTGQLVLRDPKDIDHYHALFDFFAGHALWADDARGFLAELAKASGVRQPPSPA